MNAADANALVQVVADWAIRREDIRALAVVGSWARGDPHEGSDLDLLLLSDRTDEYCDSQEWLAEIDFESGGYRIASSKGASYGVVWSCHVEMLPTALLELTFAQRSWARADIVDAGTRCVVENAFHIVFDKDGMLSKLVSAVLSEMGH